MYSREQRLLIGTSLYFHTAYEKSPFPKQLTVLDAIRTAGTQLEHIKKDLVLNHAELCYLQLPETP